ncbi:NUDIX domain-containing protein [Priestia megaterium]|uniref:NUDIX domain-containing protein n=1 Tax=Priestia megaterium TaxID=1404 RepID=UPI0012D97F78|nr:NUDIX domain-containing protein [Priestia megaterium]MCT9852032.1 NUDIX domain-containing protein [Priestia megaterium]MDF1962939.1 NUDIX domain-containing protein [Priestia megaterium]MUL34000.1 Nucleoside triphosphatase NudI [Priestia megaterium]
MNRKDYYYDEHAPKPQVIVPAVSAVIFHKGTKILLQERMDNGKWSLPGGTMEPGETVEIAIKREVKEETGFDIEVKQLLGIYSDPNHVIAYANGEVRQQFSICFLGEIKGGSLIISHESKRVEFVPINELDKIEMHIAQKIRIQDALRRKSEAFIR